MPRNSRRVIVPEEERARDNLFEEREREERERARERENKRERERKVTDVLHVTHVGMCI